MKLDTRINNVLDETFALRLEFVFFRAYSCLREYNHAVLCYSCMSLSKNQYGLIFCFLSCET